jgi:hypothetical protein
MSGSEPARLSSTNQGRGEGYFCFFDGGLGFAWERSLPATLLTFFGLFGLLRSLDAFDASFFPVVILVWLSWISNDRIAGLSLSQA